MIPITLQTNTIDRFSGKQLVKGTKPNLSASILNTASLKSHAIQIFDNHVFGFTIIKRNFVFGLTDCSIKILREFLYRNHDADSISYHHPRWHIRHPPPHTQVLTFPQK